jgi:glycogen operon protein
MLKSLIGVLLGASFTHVGLEFKLFSQNATRVEVCLFSEAIGQDPVKCIPLIQQPSEHVWWLGLTTDELKALGLSRAQQKRLLYGYRIWGPNWEYQPAWKPGSSVGFHADVDAHGNRFNPNKLVLDPYALEISHGLEDVDDVTVFESGALHRTRDSAPFAPKGVILPRHNPELRVPKPGRAFKDEVIYEVHVKGFTMADSVIDQRLRGTYKGAALKAPYLKDLGVTAVEFLPVQSKVSMRNQSNYWGYMTLGYFAPERSYAFDKSPGGPTREFREMVEEFHRHGIKVYVDVVYNHTGEGGARADDPAVSSIYSFRGIDNATYYELAPDQAHYMDNTGCGHNFATFREPVRDFIMDSLRYWKDELGVDGYRFDLAPVLGNVPRNGRFHFDGEDPRGVLKRAVNELPVRPEAGGDGVDLISEPWGVGEGTFVQGLFPKGWSEWNAETFRDPLRSFFNKRGIEAVRVGQVADAISGSSSLFSGGDRRPWNSVNIITAHDGFTLKDLFSFNDKQNNQPWPYGPSDGGENNNRSWDAGGDPSLQRQMARTAMMAMLLSAGVPHITGGDEFLRTLHGNNNPWNLDSIGNYLDWSTLSANQNHLNFMRGILRFRNEHPALRPDRFFQGRDLNGNGLKDIAWYTSDGREMTSADFDRTNGFIAYRLDTSTDSTGVRSIYAAFNAEGAGMSLKLPAPAAGYQWHRVADTDAWFETKGNVHPPGSEEVINGEYGMHPRCALLLVEKRAL